HGAILTRTGQALAVRAEGDCEDRAFVTEQAVNLLAGAGVPGPHRTVLAGAGQEPAVRTEGDAADRPLVPAQGADFLAREQVPDDHGTVRAGAGDMATIRVDGHAPDAARVAPHGEQQRIGAERLQVIPLPVTLLPGTFIKEGICLGIVLQAELALGPG